VEPRQRWGSVSNKNLLGFQEHLLKDDLGEIADRFVVSKDQLGQDRQRLGNDEEVQGLQFER